ncbi:MAG: branched-chain amino acid aminotransferase, partial [Bacteroidales bacterium]|jgi:branched-chain amino acid aminotransferase|nr:branched-chain amino acid aminotransferase [Bacteroidales bacterium]MDD4067955.1 branched-chain amino acid aminotransferase [Bacteroidales bacterium]MDD4739817.1 branched-chain amino acid aminotransferase [Bacteroidales bacterium]MDY4790564.1 branched-chain amino acid aminotransferase [Bacteroidales bacterium]NCC18452.1 branched-chain amino acid aminotransferase [Bacteroidia bacterium]
MNDINWSGLPFGYYKTDWNVRCYYRNGKWGELEFTQSEEITMHMAATCLHYGQAGFEGMKAFRGVDGKIRLFRPYENAKRMFRTAEGIMMAPVPEDLFVKACVEVVKRNERFVPPAGSGASLYLRPLLIGTGAEVGVKPADEYLFMVFVGPVGPYFKAGFKPVKFQIVEDFDRAAPLGTGTFKVGGNYAASLKSGQRAHDEGFSNCIYLDAIHKKYIDEAGAANFFGIKNNTYCTPQSSSILPSITNMSLRQLAEDLGMKVEQRPIDVEELSTFEEVAACGTAAVISPIGQIVDRGTGKVYDYGNEAGPVCTKLYETLTGIQQGSVEDKHNWNLVVE